MTSADREVATEPDELHTPLTTLLSGIGWGQHNNFHHFADGPLFWSLTRLFECYERILAVAEAYRNDRNYDATMFTAGDMEHFLIRYRVILNDLAFIIHQSLPKAARHLPSPKGGRHQLDREMSMNALLNFVSKYPKLFPDLTRLLEQHRSWMIDHITRRDDVVHYKAQVLILGTELCLRFGTVSRAPVNATQLPSEPLATYVNGAVLNLWKFMHVDLVSYFSDRIISGELRYKQFGIGVARMRCIGLRRFKFRNADELKNIDHGKLDRLGTDGSSGVSPLNAVQSEI